MLWLDVWFGFVCRVWLARVAGWMSGADLCVGSGWSKLRLTKMVGFHIATCMYVCMCVCMYVWCCVCVPYLLVFLTLLTTCLPWV